MRLRYTVLRVRSAFFFLARLRCLQCRRPGWWGSTVYNVWNMGGTADVVATIQREAAYHLRILA